MSSDTETPAIADRLGACEVCAKTNAKYTCPKCEVKTCSLKCVNIHKKELQCDGIRDPTKFVTLNNFTNVDLLNDYRMLEKVGRVVEGFHDKKLVNEYKRGRRILPKRLMKLKSILERRKTTINFLPSSFERHKKNRTYVHNNKKLVFWNIEWIFPNAENIKIFEHGICENRKFSAVLHKYLNGQLDDFQSSKLHFYQAAGAANVVLFLKAENVKGDKYYELDADETIQNNLEGKVIVEYPIVYVVLKEHSSMYKPNIIDLDCEEELPIKRNTNKNPGNVVLAQLLNDAAKENDTKSRNLLFVTGYSDAEISTDED